MYSKISFFLALVTALIFFSSCNTKKVMTGSLPNLTFKTDQGESINLSSLKNKVTLLAFWATWCGPCIAEIPELTGLVLDLDTTKFRVISIVVDDPNGEKSKIIKQNYGINYPILFAPNEDVYSAFGGIRALPTSFIVSPEGKYLDKIEGLMPPGYLKEKLSSLIKDTFEP